MTWGRATCCDCKGPRNAVASSKREGRARWQCDACYYRDLLVGVGGAPGLRDQLRLAEREGDQDRAAELRIQVRDAEAAFSAIAHRHAEEQRKARGEAGSAGPSVAAVNRAEREHNAAVRETEKESTRGIGTRGGTVPGPALPLNRPTGGRR